MKTCDEMIRDVHGRIAAYDAEKKRRRKKALKLAAVCLPAAVLAVTGAGLLINGRLFKAPVRYTGNTAAEVEIVTDAAVTDAAVTETEPGLSEQDENPGCRNSGDRLGDAYVDGKYYLQELSGAEEYTPGRYLGKGSDFEGFYAETDTGAEFYTANENEDIIIVLLDNGAQINLKRTDDVPEGAGQDDSAAPEKPPAKCDVCLREGDTPSEYINLIRSYPVSGEYCYAVPPDGTCALTVPLSAAMEEYGDTANYLLVLHLFSNQTRLFDAADLTAEAERLKQYGYISAIETDTTQEGSSTLLSLNVTFDQIRNFPKEENRSYFLWLYDEENG